MGRAAGSDHRRGARTSSRGGALEQWAAAVAEHGLCEAVLIARDNATRTGLNAAARELRAGQGALGEERDYGAVRVAVGDRVIARRNDRRYDVDNGTRGTIEAVHAHGVMLRADNGLRTELPAAYVAEHLEAAYCLTGHGMQGATVEAAIVVAAPRDLTAGWSYTALSRARGVTQLQLIVGQTTDAEQERAEHAPGEAAAVPERKEVLGAVAARMLIRDDEDLAIAQLGPGTIAAAVDDPELHAARAATGPAQEHGVTAQESGRIPLAHLRGELAAVQAQRELLPTRELAELAVAEQQAARAGEQLLMLTERLEKLPAPRGRLRGGDRRAIERGALQDAVQGAEQQLAAATRRAGLLGEGIADPAGVLAQDAALQRRAGELSRELRGRVDELVDRELAAPSAELVELVGERPQQRAPALRWENRARPVAAYRAKHEISEPGLGPEPEEPERQRAWQRAGRALEDRARGLGLDR